jgi:YD repeat-containing protein
MWEERGTVTRAYDAFGDQLRVTDAMGNETNYAFDKLGRNTSITSGVVDVISSWPFQADGWPAPQFADYRRLVTYTEYDEAGQRVAQVNGAGERTQYTYDLRGNVVAVAQPLQFSRAAYDTNGKQIGALDGNGNLATWTYDAFGHLTAQIDLGAAVYSFAYDQAGQLVSKSNTRGQDLSFSYDAAGQLIGIHDGASNETLGSQSQDTTYAYNLAGQRVTEKTIRHLGGFIAVDQDQSLGYDALGRLVLVEALDGLTVQYAFDAVGNRMRQWNHFSAGGTVQDQSLFQAYDAMNRQILVDGAANNDATNRGNVNSEQGHLLAYDKNGNRIQDIGWGRRVVPICGEADGVTYLDGFSAFDGVVTDYYTYDALNRLTGVAQGAFDANNQEFNGPGLPIDSRRYDAASRLVLSGNNGSPGLLLGFNEQYLYALTDEPGPPSRPTTPTAG